MCTRVYRHSCQGSEIEMHEIEFSAPPILCPPFPTFTFSLPIFLSVFSSSLCFLPQLSEDRTYVTVQIMVQVVVCLSICYECIVATWSVVVKKLL